ncbi:MAG: tetratricopeptide repeat protein [Plectolyngbya sp. WJT66-NPBG17]|jgi:Flp pilus assembly protein TadD|nr:tetratricopeptide repeat protein [Plectolyngbya sp. WJT66-NPBG17]
MFDLTLQHYKDTLLPIDKARQLSEAEILEILIARDSVQAALQEKSEISGANLALLSQLDRQLREHATQFAPYTDSETWRTSYSPNEKAWWWFLKDPHKKSSSWIWNTISIVCLTVSLSLVGDISPRFLTGGSDTFGAFAISTQSVLTLLTAGGALTKAGQEANKRILQRLNISESYWHQLGAAFSVLLVLSLFGTRLSLPWLATKYTASGIHQFERKQWGSAEARFKRSLQLNADDTEAHFWLGRLYEELQQPKEARPHYQRAAQDQNLDASNNLARLYILEKNYPAAIVLLNQALSTEQSIPPATKHALLKNFAWARFEQGDLADAESKILEAIDLQKSANLDKNIAAPYCLLAQVLDKKDEKEKARSQWELCNQNAAVYNSDEDQWAIMAQKRLDKKEQK